jgi:hypothetical protein
LHPLESAALSRRTPIAAIRTGFLLLPTARGRSISVLPARKVASAKSTRVSMFARTGASRVFRNLSLGLEPKRPTENELSDFSQLWHDGCGKTIIEAQDVDRNHSSEV